MSVSNVTSVLSPQGTPYTELPHFVNARGKYIFCRSWETPEGTETRALAFICHGVAEHSGRYQPLAEVLVAKGIQVYSHDHVGHGQSQGKRLNVTDFNHLVKDVLQHTDVIKEKHPGLPIFLIGHSMGGAVAVLAMKERSKDFTGCVLISSVIQTNPLEVTPFKVLMAKLTASMFPNFGIQQVDPKWLSRCSDEVEDYVSDPLVYHGPIKARIAVQILKAMDTIAASIDDINWPFFVLHGDEDRICLVDGARWMHENAKSKDKTLKIYTGHYHVLHRELSSDAAVVKQDILRWIEDRIHLQPAGATGEQVPGNTDQVSGNTDQVTGGT